MSTFKIMWVWVMFDLPTKTKKDKKRYHWFHKKLEQEAFLMIQYSVYAKVFSSVEAAQRGLKHMKRWININIKRGNIRTFTITDKQFSNMEIIIGEPSSEEINEPKQLLLF